MDKEEVEPRKLIKHTHRMQQLQWVGKALHMLKKNWLHRAMRADPPQPVYSKLSCSIMCLLRKRCPTTNGFPNNNLSNSHKRFCSNSPITHHNNKRIDCRRWCRLSRSIKRDHRRQQRNSASRQCRSRMR
eukprot:Colp12_sorted_trinity150504_noHs@1621